MERIEKAIDKFWETVFGLWIVFWLSVFFICLFAFGGLLKLWEHRTASVAIAAAIVWIMVASRV